MDPKKLILSRMGDYGDPVSTFNAVSDLIKESCGIHVSPLTCVRVLQSVKIIRERYKHNQDNLDDLAAYETIERMIVEADKRY